MSKRTKVVVAIGEGFDAGAGDGVVFEDFDGPAPDDLADLTRFGATGFQNGAAGRRGLAFLGDWLGAEPAYQLAEAWGEFGAEIAGDEGKHSGGDEQGFGGLFVVGADETDKPKEAKSDGQTQQAGAGAGEDEDAKE